MKKRLSEMIGKEERVHVDYACVKFMGESESYSTEYGNLNPEGVWFTFKPIKEHKFPEEMHIHLRVPCTHGESHTKLSSEKIVDVDVYVPMDVFIKKLSPYCKLSEKEEEEKE